MQERDTATRRGECQSGWRYETEDLERRSYLLVPESLLDDPNYHDGWSRVRRRPSIHRKEV